MDYRFGNCVLDVDRRELRRANARVPVEPQVFDLLVYLVQNRGRVVSKDDLIATVWGGRIVSDSALTTRINAARSAIGDSGKAQRLIETFPRKGFRFVGDVRDDVSASPESAYRDGAPVFVMRAEARAACVLTGEDEGGVLRALRGSRDAVIARLERGGARLCPSRPIRSLRYSARREERLRLRPMQGTPLPI